MTKKKTRKTPKFQYGIPFDMSRSGGIKARISVDFKKILSSWFNVSDLLPSRTGIDGERLKNIIPTVFQRHESEPSTRTLKTPHHTSKKTATRFYIDTGKLKKIKTLNSKEKENLIQILNELKCENDAENKQIKHYRGGNKRKKRTSVVKKANNSFPKENKVKNMKYSSNKKKKTALIVGKARKSRSKLSQFSECKQCTEIFDKTNKTQNRKLKQPPTTIVSSAGKLLQTLMTDPRAFGDINKQQIENTEGHSSSSINTIYRKNKNICIKSIEFKYLKPTYVVQYNTNDSNTNKYKTSASTNSNSGEGSYLRQRLYSTAALDAHLGQTSAPDYHEGKPHPIKESMHYNESKQHIIGMGHVTEEMLKERENSNNIDSKRECTREYVPNELPTSQGERATKWQRDPLPSYLLPTEQRAGSVSFQKNPVQIIKEPKGRKCIDFVKKCLCLPNEKKDDQNKFYKVESVKTNMHKQHFLRKRKKSPQNNNNNDEVLITRITQDDFFQGKESTTKNKQNLQKKGKVQRVSFNSRHK